MAFAVWTSVMPKRYDGSGRRASTSPLSPAEAGVQAFSETRRQTIKRLGPRFRGEERVGFSPPAPVGVLVPAEFGAADHHVVDFVRAVGDPQGALAGVHLR